VVLDRNGNNQPSTLSTPDNSKEVPVMIAVLSTPRHQRLPQQAYFPFRKSLFRTNWQRTLKDSMRSTLYDTVSDRYPSFSGRSPRRVGVQYNIRKDALPPRRPLFGGICSSTPVWQIPRRVQPRQFSGGSFASSSGRKIPQIPRRPGLPRKGSPRTRNAISAFGCKTAPKTRTIPLRKLPWPTSASQTP